MNFETITKMLVWTGSQRKQGHTSKK